VNCLRKGKPIDGFAQTWAKKTSAQKEKSIVFKK